MPPSSSPISSIGDSAPFDDKELYIIGKMTDYKLDNESTRMKFNAVKGVYENSLFLKQGYYNYAYVTVDHHDAALQHAFLRLHGRQYH